MLAVINFTHLITKWLLIHYPWLIFISEMSKLVHGCLSQMWSVEMYRHSAGTKRGCSRKREIFMLLVTRGDAAFMCLKWLNTRNDKRKSAAQSSHIHIPFLETGWSWVLFFSWTGQIASRDFKEETTPTVCTEDNWIVLLVSWKSFTRLNPCVKHFTLWLVVKGPY